MVRGYSGTGRRQDNSEVSTLPGAEIRPARQRRQPVPWSWSQQ